MSDAHVEPAEHVERGVPKARQRRTRLVGGLVILLTALLVGAIVVAALALDRLSTLQDDATKGACSDRLVSDYAAATGRALAAPPAPNAERLASIIDIQRSANRLAHSDEVCDHGVPAPLVPTPTTVAKN